MLSKKLSVFGFGILIFLLIGCEAQDGDLPTANQNSEPALAAANSLTETDIESVGDASTEAVNSPDIGLAKASTVPFCATAGTDSDGDGWGYENSLSCIVPGVLPVCSSAALENPNGLGWEDDTTCWFSGESDGTRTPEFSELPGCLGGLIWYDLDNNGLRGVADLLADDVLVELISSEGETIDFTESFDGVFEVCSGHGNNQLVFEVPAGYTVRGYDASSGSYALDVGVDEGAFRRLSDVVLVSQSELSELNEQSGSTEQVPEAGAQLQLEVGLSEESGESATKDSPIDANIEGDGVVANPGQQTDETMTEVVEVVVTQQATGKPDSAKGVEEVVARLPTQEEEDRQSAANNPDTPDSASVESTLSTAESPSVEDKPVLVDVEPGDQQLAVEGGTGNKSGESAATSAESTAPAANGESTAEAASVESTAPATTSAPVEHNGELKWGFWVETRNAYPADGNKPAPDAGVETIFDNYTFAHVKALSLHAVNGDRTERSYVVNVLEAAERFGVSLDLQLGSSSEYGWNFNTNRGNFNLDKWIDSISRFGSSDTVSRHNPAQTIAGDVDAFNAIVSAIENGTIRYIFLIDEPNHKRWSPGWDGSHGSNAPGDPNYVSNAMLDTMAQHVKSVFGDQTKTIVRTSPTNLIVSNRGGMYRFEHMTHAYLTLSSTKWIGGSNKGPDKGLEWFLTKKNNHSDSLTNFSAFPATNLKPSLMVQAGFRSTGNPWTGLKNFASEWWEGDIRYPYNGKTGYVKTAPGEMDYWIKSMLSPRDPATGVLDENGTRLINEFVIFRSDRLPTDSGKLPFSSYPHYRAFLSQLAADLDANNLAPLIGIPVGWRGE